MCQDIVLVVDYHDENCVIRRFDAVSGGERMLKTPNTREALLAVVAEARAVAEPRRGRVVWIMESTTGWARVKALLGRTVRFVLANVVQMPKPPKGNRKTDRIDTAQMLTAYRTGRLPIAATLPLWWRRVRRLVAWRENLVSRQTALRNWINRFLAHETWEMRANLWSVKGRRVLCKVIETQQSWDRLALEGKLAEFDLIAKSKSQVEAEMEKVFRRWPRAQRLEKIDGIGMISAVSIAARIGPVHRFASVEELIAYAGLAPGVYQSSGTRRDGRLGGPGTDRHLRHYLMEATVWARRIPRYRDAYERVERRRGKKIGRLVVARMLLRSIYKMLRKSESFRAEAAPAPAAQSASATTTQEQPRKKAGPKRSDAALI